MQKEAKEIDFKEIIEIILKYKRSILSIVIISTSFMWVYLYFAPSIYRSSALIEVKSNQQSNIIGENTPGLVTIGKEKIDKEIEILQTFYINNIVLNRLDFKTRYFIDSGFKKAEIYENIPIKIKDIAIFDNKILGKEIQIIPDKDGFYIKIQKSFFSKLSQYNPLQEKDKEIILDEKKKYKFDETIETDYFALNIKKLHKLEKPIYFALQGDSKNIFDSIQDRLLISKVTDFAPLINVQFEDNIVERADKYVNTLIDTFIEKSIEDKGERTGKLITFIDKQLVESKKELNQYELKLEKYQIENDAIQTSLQGTNYINELSKIENELSQYSLKEELIQSILSAVTQKDSTESIETSLIKLDDVATMSLINKLQEIQIKEEELRAKYSYKHPSLRPIRKQIYHIQRNIIKNVKNLESRVHQEIQSLNKLKLSYEKKLDSLPTKERKLIGLKRDYEVGSTIYNNLLKKKTESQIIKVAIQSDYRVIDYANNTQAIPVKPKRSFMLLLSILLGFTLGTIQAFIRNYFDDKIKSKNELENLTNLPIYGITPELKKKNIRVEVLNAPQSPYAESFRSLRTNLQFAPNINDAHIILVTSTIMGEGKSTTIANLGAIFQMANHKSIVLNLDLRKPTLHHYFGVDNSAGMSTYLSGTSSISDIIQSTKYNNLDIISSGPIPPNPSELILTDKLDVLLDQLKEVYDYIFIDTAPLGLVSDTMHLMQYADINLIVFRANYTKKSFVRDLNSLVKKHGLKHIGLVMNAVDVSSGSYGYGYGYGYGDKNKMKNENENIIDKIKGFFSNEF